MLKSLFGLLVVDEKWRRLNEQPAVNKSFTDVAGKDMLMKAMNLASFV